MLRVAALACLLLPPLLVTGAAVRAADRITLYHCTDDQDRLTLRDSPCPKGQRQDVRTMLRPQDPPPDAARIERAAAPAPRPAAAQVIVVNTPRPLYACVTPDGERYTSDSAEGNPRWVPLWTLGYPVTARDFVADSGQRRGLRASDGLSAPPRAGLSIPPPRERPRPDPPRFATRPHRPFAQYGIGYDAGTWVRDACHALPQAEVCARLADQRDRLRTRFFNAQQRERDALRVEERGLNARLASDCGIG